jgi:hypothetical protein
MEQAMPDDIFAPAFRVPSIRTSPSTDQVLSDLGPLRDLPGTWEGHGFNLVARPDFENNANLFLELNLTKETLKFDPISAPVPNRGVGQNDVELFGLTYLQKISDLTTGGALHIEPGIWITAPNTTDPEEPASIARMGSIPHGNALLAEGTATSFTGNPTLSPGDSATGGNPAFSLFPSFNTTPFIAPTPPAPTVIFAAGSSEALSAPAGTHGGFPQYTLANPASAANPRTPLGDSPAVLPPAITQAMLNDPILFLQQEILQQYAEGHTFKGTALNIATSSPIAFATTPNVLTPTQSVTVAAGPGVIGNTPFLATNANAALVYATFWIETVIHPHRRPFMQLQYAQMVLLNFPANLIPGKPNFSWPHVSVGTLRKTFG